MAEPAYFNKLKDNIKVYRLSSDNNKISLVFEIKYCSEITTNIDSGSIYLFGCDNKNIYFSICNKSDDIDNNSDNLYHYSFFSVPIHGNKHKLKSLGEISISYSPKSLKKFENYKNLNIYVYGKYIYLICDTYNTNSQNYELEYYRIRTDKHEIIKSKNPVTIQNPQ